MEISKLESKLAKMGRSVRCVDSRNRPGHPPDYVCHFSGRGVSLLTDASGSLKILSVVQRSPFV
jgi:hypothetical protein